jgi:hypothetical protein
MVSSFLKYNSDMRYKELKYQGKTYTETYQINEILADNKFLWFLEAELSNIRLEILKNTLVINSGIWYNGTFKYGVIRNLEWRYGSWENGVWYNGIFWDGIFKSGLIYNGTFYKGQFLSGVAKNMMPNSDYKTNHEFINCDISPNFKIEE